MIGKPATITFVSPTCLASCKPANHDWIIDTGASDHITTSFEHLIEPIAIHSIILLPNGKISSITHKGTIKLSKDIVLKNVFYVPELQFNLISGSKFAANYN